MPKKLADLGVRGINLARFGRVGVRVEGVVPFAVEVVAGEDAGVGEGGHVTVGNLDAGGVLPANHCLLARRKSTG